jgi:integron integrase
MNAIHAVQKLREVIRRQHKALATEESYTHWLRRYIGSLGRIPAELSSEKKLERFLTDLALRQGVAASTQNQAFNAIVFFYKEVLGTPLHDVKALRVTRPPGLRHAPTVGQTQALLQAVRDLEGYPTNLVARLLYGCGLRVSEPLNLRIKDVDLAGGKLFIRGAKGGKDRVVSLPRVLGTDLAKQIQRARTVWEFDKRDGIPVELPHQLARKYPDYRFVWPWAWLFPARNPCIHPRTRQLVRYRMHEANVQRAIKIARQKLGILVLPHELRHAYATHCLERGANPRSIQEAMGHVCLETTMGYLHAESMSVKSPLDTIPSPEQSIN